MYHILHFNYLMYTTTQILLPYMKSAIKIISWNVNGIRAVLKKGFLDFVKTYKPDILCLQETKAERGQAVIDLPEYEEFWNSATKKGYSGTAIFSKIKPKSVGYGLLPHLYTHSRVLDHLGRNADQEGRIVTLEFDSFFVVNVYTPNAKDDLSRLAFRHRQWDPLFLKHLQALEKKKPVVACGDFNVAHEAIDLARPKENEGLKGFTKEEREGFGNFLKAGFVDVLRKRHPGEAGLYTWWSHWANARERNVGWRIDYVIASKRLEKQISDAFILPSVTGSDHCPVGIEIEK